MNESVKKAKGPGNWMNEWEFQVIDASVGIIDSWQESTQSSVSVNDSNPSVEYPLDNQKQLSRVDNPIFEVVVNNKIPNCD